PPRVMHRPARRLLLQLAHAAQDVAQALLVRRLAEAAVRREAVVGHLARPIQADQPLQRVGAALPGDGVARRAVADPGMQPRRPPPDAPARLVRRQARRGLDLLAGLLLGWPLPGAVPQ